MGIVEIHTLSGDKIPISELVILRIASPIQNSIHTSLMHLPHIMGIKLAHPVTDDENFELSNLIGGDYYWTFIEDQVIRGKKPTAVASKLGYLLSGPPPGAYSQTSTASLFHVSAEATSYKQFWNIKSARTQPTMEDADKQFLKSYMKNRITCQQDAHTV